MIETIVASIVVMGVLIAAMAVGVIFSNKPIKGSCGGMSALGMKDSCDICGGKPSLCDEKPDSSATKTAAIAYDANK